MQFKIPKYYDCSAEVYNLTNPFDGGQDQYVPNFELVATIKCFFGIHPNSGRLTMEVPDIIQAKTPFIRNPKNKFGQELGRQDYVWQCGPAIPIINAYGQIEGYRYITIESENG